jgi:hypothetical protein
VTGKPRLVDGADVAEGMTVQYGGRALTVKGIADALEGGRRRNAYAHNAEGRPSAFPVYRGDMYPVLDASPAAPQAEAGQ